MSVRTSIIVCTRNRATSLERTLESIYADRSGVEREVIVVDNASTDDTRALVTRHARTAPISTRLVSEPAIGHSRARNAGVSAAQGDVLVFTDDDVLVHDGWADAITAAFDDPRVGAAAGRILPAWPSEPPAWMVDGPHAQLLTLIDYGEINRELGEDEPPVGANMAIRASVACSFTPLFDESLGHRGDRRMAHEEYLLMHRVAQTHAIAYRADAVIRHCITADRMDLGWMRRTFFDLGVGLGRRIRIDTGHDLSMPRRIVRLSRTALGAYRARRENKAAPTGAGTWNELQAAMWAGRHFEMVFGRSHVLVDSLSSLITGRR